MPIYAINEGIFDKAPEEFKKFALDFYKKVNKKKALKPKGGKTFEASIKGENPKWLYNFDFDDPRLNFAGAMGTAAATGFVSGAVAGAALGSGPVGTAVGMSGAMAASSMMKSVDEDKERKDIGAIIKSCGFTSSGKDGIYDFYKISSNKKYIYNAWPAVASEGKYLSTYGISLKCYEYEKGRKSLKLNETSVDMSEKDQKNSLGSIFNAFDDPDLTTDLVGSELRKYVPYPQLERAFVEAFDYSDKYTRKQLIAMTEAEHNKVLTDLTSKLYDKIVSKAHNIDYGEIPKTKGDISKLSNFEELKDTLGIIKGIIKEYKQDSKPVDDISVAISNIQARKEMFERAFRYDCELPILMYDNMVMAVVTGTTYLITSCIEFIKAPKDETFSIQLDKVAYNKSKDGLIYNSISKFNKSCESGDFDKAMEMIIDKKVRKFTGIEIGAGIVAGVIILTNIIPILRELTYMYYYNRTKISDFFAVQADLLTMNAYNLQHNDSMDVDEREEIAEKQLAIATKFRNISNIFNIEKKRCEVSATKDIENSNKKYKLDSETNIVSDEEDNDSDSSVLF